MQAVRTLVVLAVRARCGFIREDDVGDMVLRRARGTSHVGGEDRSTRAGLRRIRYRLLSPAEGGET